MELATFQMAAAEAEEALGRWGGASAPVRTAYERLAQGATLVSLTAVLDPEPPKGYSRLYPTMAYAPVGATEVYCCTEGHLARMGCSRHGRGGTVHRLDRDMGIKGVAKAAVPPVWVPSRAGDIVLFEVETWFTVKAKAVPAPKDPALLRPVVGDLYEVITTWDLTELERAALM